MISEASPIGTWRSVRKSNELAPGSSTPTTAEAAASALVSRSAAVPRRQATIPSMSVPAIRKRVPAAKNGGIVSPASSIPR